MLNGSVYIRTVDSTELLGISKQLFNATQILRIDLNIDYWNNLFNHIKFYEYLTGMNNDEMPPKFLIHIFIGLNRAKIYLAESHVWYRFLITMHTVLSDYNVQKDVELHLMEVLRLMHQLTIEENEVKNIN